MAKYVVTRSFRDLTRNRKLFREGDPYEPRSEERAERLLQKGFIVPVEAGATASGDESPQDIDLGSMTVAELRTYASENGIELTATKKADIIEEISRKMAVDTDEP